MKFVLAYTTCDKAQANGLIKRLLDKRLVACAKKLPIEADYWWQGKVEKANEIMLLLETAEEKLAEIESLFIDEHDYDTFILAAMPLVYVSEDAQKWWRGVLGK